MVNELSPSKIIEINGLIKVLEAKGEKIFSLCIGEPDYLPPEAVLEGTVSAFVPVEAHGMRFDMGSHREKRR